MQEGSHRHVFRLFGQEFDDFIGAVGESRENYDDDEQLKPPDNDGVVA